MARGGSRPGAGPKPNPNSGRQRAKAAKAEKAARAAAEGFSPTGVKSPAAPKSWAFGIEPAQPVAAASSAAEASCDLSPLDYLLSIVRNTKADERIRIQAASIAAPYVHAKKGEGGKKEQQAENAKKVAGRFAPSAPPKLIAAGGKKV